jgi:hypothetical protein
MSKNDFENKSLAFIILYCYILNISLGWIGFFFPNGTSIQLVLYQIGNAFAISASVMAGRYTGLRGQHVAASAYILLGITHGISLAALSTEGINVDRESTMAMPMIPALVFMFWCNIYPLWLRVSALLPAVCFTMVYMNVHLGNTSLGWTLYFGYATLQIIEVAWGVYIFRDWKKNMVHKQ